MVLTLDVYTDMDKLSDTQAILTIPHIGHFFYTHTFLAKQFYTQKSAYIYKKNVSCQKSVNYNNGARKIACKILHCV